MATFPPQPKPGQNGDVVVPMDAGLAVGAAGRGEEDRLAGGDAVDDHVEEATDGGAEEEDQEVGGEGEEVIHGGWAVANQRF